MLTESVDPRRASLARVLMLACVPVFVLSLAPLFSTDRVVASDGVPGDELGAAIAASPTTLVVGARSDDLGTGAAYVYRRDQQGWTEQCKLTASDATMGSGFGWSVALDGNTLAVGAPWRSGAQPLDGAIYVFERRGRAWVETDVITVVGSSGFDLLGSSLAMHGGRIVAGVFPRDTHRGVAYVFQRRGASWVQEAELNASDGESFDFFGWSVAIHGSTIAIGAWGEADYRGAAYVFQLGQDGWTERAKLTADVRKPFAQFGFAVAVGDNAIVVGASGDDALAQESGAVHVFDRVGGAWQHAQKITASDGGYGAQLGGSLAMHGATFVAGAHGDDGFRGAAYVFQRSAGAFHETQKLVAFDAAVGDGFGTSVSILGTTIGVGAPQANAVAGAGYVFW